MGIVFLFTITVCLKETSMQQADIRFITDMITTLAGISESCAAGVQRRSYTAEYRKGVDYVKEKMLMEGLEVHEDALGNLFGRLAPGDSGNINLPAIYSGSHLDTVKCAGAYDGIAGVICALEAARMIQRSGKPLRHPYMVFGTIEEEGTRFGQVVLGSKFMAGVFDESALDRFQDPETGRTFRQVLDDYQALSQPERRRPEEDISASCQDRSLEGGSRTLTIKESRLNPEKVKAFVELHGEQGAVLEHENCDIGVVNCVAGIIWMEITISGMAGHSGTVPMKLRRDAGVAGAEMILDLNHYVTDNYSGRATLTAGRFLLDPGSANCIPGKSTFSLDIRSGDREILRRISTRVEECAARIRARGYGVDINILSQRDPIIFDESIRGMIGESADKRGLSYRPIDSGAGHDSMVFAAMRPTGMIFLPNRDGLSHHPDEYISPEDLKKGAEVLYDTIRRIDETEDM